MVGRFCFFHQDENATTGLEVTIAENGSAKAEHFGAIHMEEQAYYAAFETELTEGKMEEDGRVSFQSLTEVDGDVQSGEEEWLISRDGAAQVGIGPLLQPDDCETLTDKVFPQPGE